MASFEMQLAQVDEQAVSQQIDDMADAHVKYTMHMLPS